MSWNIAQAAPGNRPAYSTTAGKNGGIAAVFASASATRLVTSVVTRAEPITLIIRAKNTADATAYHALADGTSANARLMRVEITTQNAIIYGGATLTSGAAWAQNAWHCFGGVFNGTGSIAALDATQGTGADGGGSATGLTLGTNGAAAVGWDGPVDHVFGWFRALSAAELEAARQVIAELP